jgi:hypothetical protein
VLKNFIDDAAVVAEFDIPDYSHGNVILVHPANCYLQGCFELLIKSFVPGRQKI